MDTVPYLMSALGGGARAELHEAQNLAHGWLLARQLPHTILLDGDVGCNTINIIGVNIIAFGREITLSGGKSHFSSAIPLFSSNIPLFCMFRIDREMYLFVCFAYMFGN